MIKANELRIGNKLFFKRSEIITVNAQVISDVGDLILSGYYKPIPLTEEWLLKFGFEETYKTKFRSKFDLPCNFIGYDFNRKTDNKGEFRFYGEYLKCDFVHQLQNLYFALTGEELELK